MPLDSDFMQKHRTAQLFSHQGTRPAGFMDMSQIMWLIPGKNIIIQVAFENFERSHMIANKHNKIPHS